MGSLRPHAPALLAAALVTLVSWPVTGDMRPAPNLDGAWMIALSQAVHDGLDFGPDVLFTYGPLGFLREPLLVYPWTARLAFGYGVLVHFVLCAALVWGLRRAVGSLIVAALLAVLFAAVMFQEPTIVIGFGGAAALAGGLLRGRWAVLVAAGLGLLCGIELLSKLNTGVTLGLLAVVALVAAPSPRRRPAAAFAVGMVAALAVGWLATGHSLGAVDDYLKGSLGIVSGYAEAMYVDQDPGARWERWAALAIAGIGLAVAWHAGGLLAARARWGLVALWAVLAFTSAKAGFIRHDPGHANIFFASVLGGLVMLAWAPHRRVTAWLIGLFVVTVLFASLRDDPTRYFAPVERAGKLLDQATLLTDGSATNDAIGEARIARLPVEELDRRLHDGARDGDVHVEPADAGLAWAQRLRWDPLPVFQSYSAYTHDLDDRNAAAVRDPEGPRHILRENNNTIDGRNPAWESPAAQREVLCHFRGAAVRGRWILLERTAPRCGRPRHLQTVTARLGEPAAVPPPPDEASVVFVRVEGIAVSGLEKLRTAAYRALPRSALLDGGRRFRLIPGTAENGLVVTVPRGADFPGPFRLDQGTRSLAFTRGTDRGDRLTLRFYAMPIR